MSYAMGAAAPAGDISVGRLAQRDPLMAFTSVMASDLLRQASSRPAGTRLAWLRSQMNAVQPGMGDTFVSQTRKLRRRGRKPNQALFDGLRLTLANQIATHLDKTAVDHSVGGLGGSADKIGAVFCGLTMAGTAAGTIAASFENPAASGAIGTSGAAALQAAGCNRGALAEQARIAEANAAAAQANAAAAAAAGAQPAGGDKTLMYVAIGGGALLLLGVGVLALKK